MSCVSCLQTAASLQDLAEDRPAGKASAPKAAASKSTQQLADTIGESDISDDEDWLTQPAEPAKPSAATPAPATGAATAAVSFAPSSLATLAQPAFQDEDDYDADEDAAAPATHLQPLLVATQAAPPTAAAASTGVQGSSAGMPTTSGSHAGPVSLLAPAIPGVAGLTVPPVSVPLTMAAAAPQPAIQAAVPVAQPGNRRRTSSLQQQVCCHLSCCLSTRQDCIFCLQGPCLARLTEKRICLSLAVQLHAAGMFCSAKQSQGTNLPALCMCCWLMNPLAPTKRADVVLAAITLALHIDLTSHMAP